MLCGVGVCAAIVGVPGAAQAHVPIVYVFGPEDDWCGFLNQEVLVDDAEFYPGDVVVLGPGEYGPCAFTALVTDNATEFTILQSQDEDDPARFVYEPGMEGPLLDITGTQLQMYDLVFEGVPEGEVGVRVTDVDNLWMRFGAFSDIAGTGLSIEGDADTVWILDERIGTTAEGTGIEVVADGSVAALRLRNNVFTGSGTAIRSGAGLEVSDSVFAGEAGLGTGIERLAVGESGTDATQLSGNAFLDLQTGIQTASDTLIRNSVFRVEGDALQVTEAATVRVLGNSIVGGVQVDGSGPDSEIADNAGVDPELGPGNIACDDPGECWRDVAANDFYPTPESPLRAGGQGTSDDALFEDFCETERVEPRTSGAIQWVGDTPWEPVEVDFRSDSQCKLFGTPDGDPDPDFDEDPPPDEPCGCASGRGGAAISVLAFVAVALRRRRRARPTAH